MTTAEKTRVSKPVCARCREAVIESGVRNSSRAMVASLARQFGADVPDHDCESTASEERCFCACNRERSS